MRHVVIGSLLGVLLSGCDDTLFGEPKGGEFTDQDTDSSYTADWNSAQQLFEAECMDCHDEGGPYAPTLPADIADDLTKGTGSYVVAGDPSASLLWRVVSDDPSDRLPGDIPMPSGTNGLSSSENQGLYQWIANGALLEPNE